MLAPKLADAVGQQIIIDNRGGAAGNIGAEVAAKSAPDGYTVLISSAAFTVTPYLYRNIGLDVEKDLIPLGLLATTPNILVTSPGTGFKSIKDEMLMNRTTMHWAEVPPPNAA